MPPYFRVSSPLEVGEESHQVEESLLINPLDKTNLLTNLKMVEVNPLTNPKAKEEESGNPLIRTICRHPQGVRYPLEAVTKISNNCAFLGLIFPVIPGFTNVFYSNDFFTTI